MTSDVALPALYDKLSIPDRKRVREQYMRLQDNNCAHCGSPLSGPPRTDIAKLHVRASIFPPSFFKWPVHLHHDRRTGMTIGAVHNKCNAVLWQYHGQ